MWRSKSLNNYSSNQSHFEKAWMNSSHCNQQNKQERNSSHKSSQVITYLQVTSHQQKKKKPQHHTYFCNSLRWQVVMGIWNNVSQLVISSNCFLNHHKNKHTESTFDCHVNIFVQVKTVHLNRTFCISNPIIIFLLLNKNIKQINWWSTFL